MDTFIYIMNFIKDRNVASITPTSSVGVKKVCSKIDFSQNNLIVEYGPGTGVFSKYMLQKMRDASRLILIERNGSFNSILQKNINDPRAVLVHDSAENVLQTLRACKESEADYIHLRDSFFLSGLRSEAPDSIQHSSSPEKRREISRLPNLFPD